MAGSIQISQPGGVGIVAGGVVNNGAAIYPTFIGATTTTWTWGIVSTKPSTNSSINGTGLVAPKVTGDDDWPLLITFTDSNGVTYMTGVIFCNSADLAVDVIPND